MRRTAFEIEPSLVIRVPAFSVEMAERVFGAVSPVDALARASEVPGFLSALRVASNNLVDAVLDAVRCRTAPKPRLLRSVFSYVVRGAYRATPYGLFSATGIVTFSNGNGVPPPTVARRRVWARPDAEWLDAVASEIEASDSAGALLYFWNRCSIEHLERIWLVAGPGPTRQLTYADGVSAWEQVPRSIRSSRAVRLVRSIFVGGATLAEARDQLAAELNRSEADITKFLSGLRDLGLLLSELRNNLDPDRLTAFVRTTGRTAWPKRRELENVVILLGAIGRASEGDARDDALTRAQQALVSAVTPGVSHPLQVDVTADVAGHLPAHLSADIEALTEYTLRLSRLGHLRRFASRFTARYEGKTAVVPLLELADSDLGLGVTELPDYDGVLRPEQRALFQERVHRCIADGAIEIELSADDADSMLPPSPPSEELHARYQLAFSVAARTWEEVQQGTYLVVPSAGVGLGGQGRYEGRFLHLMEDHRRNLENRRRADYEETGVLPVELYYLSPLSRTANVAARAPVGDTAMYAGLVGDGSDGEIDPAECVVLFDRDGRLHIRSLARDVELAFTETHALNAARAATNLARLAAMISQDGRRRIFEFPWEEVHVGVFYPRIRIGRVVLSPARWKVRRELLSNAARTGDRSVLDELRIPDRFFCGETDQVLFFDFNVDLSRLHLVSVLGSLTEADVLLTEQFPDAWLRQGADSYSHELIASVRSRKIRRDDDGKSSRHLAQALLSRDRTPDGSAAWLYLRWYAPKSTFDRLMSQDLSALAELAHPRAAYFVVRYDDARPHLRIRFRVREESRSEILRGARSVLASGSVQKMEIGAYDREVERYGGECGMRWAEDLFCKSTETVSEALRTPSSSDRRIELALDSFRSAHEELFIHCSRWHEVFRPAGRLTSAEREILRRLEKTFSVPTQAKDGSGPDRSNQIAVSLADFVSSVFHMHCNRAGLSNDSERSAGRLLWHAIQGWRARNGGAIDGDRR